MADGKQYFLNNIITAIFTAIKNNKQRLSNTKLNLFFFQ